MRRAVDAAKRSISEEGKTPPSPRVGVVIVQDGELVGESFRGATGPTRHAEYGLLEELADVDLTGAEVYTTLEPCSRRNPPKRPCAERVVQAGLGTVYIGSYDPNPTIYREGWRMLRDAGVVLKDFYPEFRNEIAADNQSFLEGFRSGVGETGRARFDYELNGGRFDVTTGGVVYGTRWTMAGKNTVYAYSAGKQVAHARYAKEFAEIDDPGALHYESHPESIELGGIAVFRGPNGFLLAKVIEVHSGPRYGDDRTELIFDWQIRTEG